MLGNMTVREPDAGLEAFLTAEAGEHRESFESFVSALYAPFAETLSIWESAIRRRC